MVNPFRAERRRMFISPNFKLSNLTHKVSKNELVELIRIRTQNYSPVKKQRWRSPKKEKTIFHTKSRCFSEEVRSLAKFEQAEIEECAATHQQMIDRFAGIVDKAKNERFHGFASPRCLNETIERFRRVNTKFFNVGCFSVMEL
jgi:hypothetical protein